MSIRFFLDLAIIIVAAKTLGILARRIHVPQVVGEIIAGLLIGPSVLGIVSQSEFLNQMAEIGVIMLMFVAGLETDLKDLKKTGVAAFFIACAGVLVPLLGGYLLYSCIYGFAAVGTDDFFKAVFIGVIMTATSVGITVQTLREMGKLKGRIGTTILSAAIIDDVIGIIVLTFVIGFKSPDVQPFMVIVNTLLFFAFAIAVGVVLYFGFKWLDSRFPHRRRLPIYAFAVCLGMAYAAEAWFGIADITGAFVAGIIFCNIRDADYIARKMDINSYMLFSPIFFAGIGLKTQFDNMTWTLLWFCILFVAVALVAKVIGCGLMARACRFNSSESLRIGVGMMTRGEVALIVSQKGLAVGLIPSEYFAAVIMLIMVSSIVTPIILKLLYKRVDKKHGTTDEAYAPNEGPQPLEF